MSWFGEIDWMGYFVQSLIKSSAALGLALALALLLRRRSASIRHFVLALFLIGLVLFPAFSVLPSGWKTRLLPSWGAAVEPGRRPVKQEWIAPPSLGPGLENRRMRIDKGLPARPAEGILVDDSSRASGSEDSFLPRENNDQPRFGLSLSGLPAAAWALGFLFLLMRIVFGLAGASKLTRESRPLADSVWRTLLLRFLSLTRLRRNVELKSHDQVAVPITWGLMRPVIIMPAEAPEWPEDRRSSALFHELSHIKRADFLIMILVRLNLAFFWFNPLSWVAFRMLRKEQEKACDELVLKAGIKPSTYAANLLLLRQAGRLPALSHVGFLGLFGNSQLNDRLRAILKQKIILKEIKMRTKIMLSVSVVCIMALIGMARPSGAAGSPSAVMDRGTEISAPDNSGPGPAVTSSQEQKQETKQERQKGEEAEKKPKDEAEERQVKTVIVKKIKSKDGTVEVFIKEGDEAKTIIADDVDVLDLDDLEGDLVVDKDWRKIIIRKGKEPRFVIEGDHWSLYKDDKGEKRIIIEKAPDVGIDIERESDLRKKLEAAQAEIEKIRKAKPEVMESLKDLDKSLKELSGELEKATKEIKEAKELEETKELEKAKKLEVTVEDKDKTRYAVAVYFDVSNKVDKAAYEKAIEKIKKDAPEGIKLESEFDEAKGRVRITINGFDPKGETRDVVKKLIDALKEELKKEPAAK